MSFPISPNTGEVHSIGNITYEWNGIAWDISGTAQTNKASVPAQGLQGLVLAKASGDDYDVEWVEANNPVEDYVEYILSTAGSANPTSIESSINIDTLYIPTNDTYSSHRLTVTFEIISGASVGFVSERIEIAHINLHPLSDDGTTVEFTANSKLSATVCDGNSIDFTYTSNSIPTIFDDGGVNEGNSGIFRLNFAVERVSGNTGDINQFFGAATLGSTKMV